MQLQAAALGDAGADHDAGTDGAVAGAGPPIPKTEGVEDEDEVGVPVLSSALPQVLQLLREHFGEVRWAGGLVEHEGGSSSTDDAKAKADAAGKAGGNKAGGGWWELTAYGHRVRLYGRTLPFVRIESDDPDAQGRVSTLVERAQQAVLPLQDEGRERDES